MALYAGPHEAARRTVRLYAEVGGDGGALLYTFEPPGLAARGYSLQEALDRALDGYTELAQMQAQATGAGQRPFPELTFTIVEQVNRRGVVGNGRTSATFGPDLAPVSAEEIPGILALLGESRRRLLELRPQLDSPGAAGLMEYRSLPHRMTIRRHLEHIASAEKWYLSHIWRDLPRLRPRRDVWQRLDAVRAQVVQTLAAAGAMALCEQTSVSGETWTVRKVVRRLMYHEKFHRDAIRRDLGLALAGRRQSQAPG
ncbi:MAG: hypothetical protein Q8P31_13615 [Bacillota bacterium]|nr:hypothetical protein [Bacillota bacterium]